MTLVILAIAIALFVIILVLAASRVVWVLTIAAALAAQPATTAKPAAATTTGTNGLIIKRRHSRGRRCPAAGWRRIPARPASCRTGCSAPRRAPFCAFR